MRRLKVVVDEAALLLLSKREVVALELCCKCDILLLLISLRLQVGCGDVLGASFSAVFHWCASCADRKVRLFELRAYFTPVSCLSSCFGLSVDL